MVSPLLRTYMNAGMMAHAQSVTIAATEMTLLRTKIRPVSSHDPALGFQPAEIGLQFSMAPIKPANEVPVLKTMMNHNE